MDDDAEFPAPVTYAEAFARLAAGGWAKIGEANNFAPGGRLVFEMEVWFRDGTGGPEWAEVTSGAGAGWGPRRWHVLAGGYDPRALLSDANWARYGPGAAG